MKITNFARQEDKVNVLKAIAHIVRRLYLKEVEQVSSRLCYPNLFDGVTLHSIDDNINLEINFYKENKSAEPRLGYEVYGAGMEFIPCTFIKENDLYMDTLTELIEKLVVKYF